MSSSQNSATRSIQYTLIVTGDEILYGKKSDRHIAFINRTLIALGLDCFRCLVIGDNDTTLAFTVKESLQQTPVVIVTGGLGPTLDDITREALVEATGIPIAEDPQALQELRERFAQIGRPMGENNLRQALVPTRGRFFSNPNGTAPGLVFDRGEQIAIALPGPPRELEPMVKESLVPYLQQRFALEKPYSSFLMRFSCLGESTIDAVVRDRLGHIEGLRVSSLSHIGTVDVTLSLPGLDQTTLKILQDSVEIIKIQLGDSIYSFENQSLQETVGRLLIERKETLSLAESCTGGLLGSQITEVPGSSQFFLGGVIAYNNGIKINILGVSPKILEEHGAVSVETAACMADGVRDCFSSSWGIGITGIAGPGGGSFEKPVGTVCIAVGYGRQKAHSLPIKLFGDREAVRQRSCIYALDQLRRSLLELPLHP